MMEECTQQYIDEQISKRIASKIKGQCKTCWDYNQTKAIYHLQHIKYGHTKSMNNNTNIPHPTITVLPSKMMPFIDYYPINHQGNPLNEPPNIKQPKWRQITKDFYGSNKWGHQQIRKQIHIKRIIGKYYRKKQNKTWKCKLKKRRRSKRRTLEKNTKNDSPNYIKRNVPLQNDQNVQKIKKYKYPNRKKYQYGSSSSNRQIKQRSTINIPKPALCPRRKKEKRKPIKTFDNALTANKSSLKICCKIIFCHNNEDEEDDQKKKEKSIYKLMKSELLIFDKLKKSYWTSFELIPCIKQKDNSYFDNTLFQKREDLCITIDNEMDKTADNDYIFYYIAQYCYETRTPYIEYKCNINPKLKKVIWKLSDEHNNNEYKNKFILNYDIKDIFQDLMPDDTALNILCLYLGYSYIGMTQIDGICEYIIDDKATADELCYMKKYDPPYIHHRKNIVDENGDLLICQQTTKRIRVRQKNGIKNWYFKQWSNIPCSMHSVLYTTGVTYIDESNADQCTSHKWPAFDGYNGEITQALRRDNDYQREDWQYYGKHWALTKRPKMSHQFQFCRVNSREYSCNPTHISWGSNRVIRITFHSKYHKSEQNLSFITDSNGKIYFKSDLYDDTDYYTIHW